MALQAVHNAQIPKVKLLQCIWWAPLHNNRQEEAYLRVSESMEHIIPIRHYSEQTWTWGINFSYLLKYWNELHMNWDVLFCILSFAPDCLRFDKWSLPATAVANQKCVKVSTYFVRNKKRKEQKSFLIFLSNANFPSLIENILTPISIYDSFSVLQNVSPCPMQAAKAMAFGMNVCCLRPRNRWLWGPIA